MYPEPLQLICRICDIEQDKDEMLFFSVTRKLNTDENDKEIPGAYVSNFEEVKFIAATPDHKIICKSCIANIKFMGMMNLLDATLETIQEINLKDK